MKTIIEMAREAGIRDCICDGTRGCLERFAALVRADEREACAKAALDAPLSCLRQDTRESCAAAIRARGNS